MGRELTVNPSGLVFLGAPVTAPPFTFSAWVYPLSLHNGAVLSLESTADNSTRWWLNLRSDAKIRFQAVVSASTSFAATTTNYVVNRWHHILGREHSASSRDIWLDGVLQGTNTQTRSPSGVDKLRIGTAGFSSAQQLNALIGEVAVYSVALQDENCRSLAAYIPPGMIANPNLEIYAIGLEADPEPDLSGHGRNMTPTSAPASRGPPVIHYLPARLHETPTETPAAELIDISRWFQPASQPTRRPRAHTVYGPY